LSKDIYSETLIIKKKKKKENNCLKLQKETQ